MTGYSITSHSEAETEALGEALGNLLFPGAFVALEGDLGAGKTALARGVARALGIEGISSPTFNIVHEYQGRIPLYHFDAYRLKDEAELYDMGFEEYLAGAGILLMEWPSNVAGALPQSRLDIAIKGSGEDTRAITFSPKEEAYCNLVHRLAERGGERRN